jgi:hypothetical protein
MQLNESTIKIKASEDFNQNLFKCLRSIGNFIPSLRQEITKIVTFIEAGFKLGEKNTPIKEFYKAINEIEKKYQIQLNTKKPVEILEILLKEGVLLGSNGKNELKIDPKKVQSGWLSLRNEQKEKLAAFYSPMYRDTILFHKTGEIVEETAKKLQSGIKDLHKRYEEKNIPEELVPHFRIAEKTIEEFSKDKKRAPNPTDVFEIFNRIKQKHGGQGDDNVTTTALQQIITSSSPPKVVKEEQMSD